LRVSLRTEANSEVIPRRAPHAHRTAELRPTGTARTWPPNTSKWPSLRKYPEFDQSPRPGRCPTALARLRGQAYGFQDRLSSAAARVVASLRPGGGGRSRTRSSAGAIRRCLSVRQKTFFRAHGATTGTAPSSAENSPHTSNQTRDTRYRPELRASRFFLEDIYTK